MLGLEVQMVFTFRTFAGLASRVQQVLGPVVSLFCDLETGSIFEGL